MKRKLSAILATVLMIAYCAGLSACADPTAGAATTGYAFVQKLVDGDYAGAYEYVYSFTSDVKTKDDFVSRYQNIYEALQISGVTLLNRGVAKAEGSENEYRLSYSLQMESGVLGTVTYDYEADIVSGPLGYTVIYMPSLILPMLEEGDTVRVTNQTGVRGEIFSADGKLLAKNDFAQSVYLDLEKSPDIEQVKQLLSSMFGTDAEAIQKKYDGAVKKGYPLEVLLTFPRDTLTIEQKERIAAVNGLGVDDERFSPIRYYPLADNAAHLIGYMGSPTDSQADALEAEGIKPNASVGQTGIEGAYESALRGADGRLIYIENEKGEVKEVLYEDRKTDGADVTLTIDTGLQNAAYTLLASNCAADQSGAVIVMDYTTGDVKAMVSYPSFDNNLFNFPMDQEMWEYFNADESLRPLYSRTTQALYMPGSTFKPFSSVPAIRQGLLAEDTSPDLNIVHEASGSDSWIPGIPGITWNYPPLYRYKTTEAFNYEISMKSSDNIFFAYFALVAGVDEFLAYMREIGMGEAPGFELPITPSNTVEMGDEVNYHMIAQAGYGIGEVVMTPMQMASLYTAIMNNGDIVNPTVVGKVSRTADNVETVEWENATTYFKTGVMPAKAIEMARGAMRRVITDGTAYEAYLWDVDGLIGKTGTAQVGEDKSREVNWAVAMNPNDGLLYLVVLETETDEGTARKLSILNGLIKPGNYDNALVTNPGADYGVTSADGDLPQEGDAEPDAGSPQEGDAEPDGG